MVVYEPDEGEYFKKFPCLVVEVLSSSTEATDRRDKLHKYRKIASLKAYVLVDSLSRPTTARSKTGFTRMWWGTAVFPFHARR